MNRPSREIYRLFDASLNRACEGIRVLEDTARMIYDHAGLTSRLKSLRHELMRTTASIPGLDLDTIMARGSERDILRSGETSSEATRTGITDIVQANSGRSQEALRSLEEFAKLIAPGLSERYKSVRFSLYDYERELMALVMRRDLSVHNRISRGLIVPVTSFISMGIGNICRDHNIGTIVLKPGNISDRDNTDIIIDATQSLRDQSVSILVHGRADMALIATSDGVMLDDSHIDPLLTRQIFGAKHIIAATISQQTDGSDSDAIDIGLVFSHEMVTRTQSSRIKHDIPIVFVTSEDCFDNTLAIPECDGIWIEIKDTNTDKIKKLCKQLKW